MNLLYSQYGITQSNKIRLKNIVPLLIKALEKENEEKLFCLWNSLYPRMIIGQIPFKSFDDYKAAIVKPRTTHTVKTTEDIVQEFKKVIEQHEGR